MFHTVYIQAMLFTISKSARSALIFPDSRGGSTNLLYLKLNVINFDFKSLDVKYALSVSGRSCFVFEVLVELWQIHIYTVPFSISPYVYCMCQRIYAFVIFTSRCVTKKWQHHVKGAFILKVSISCFAVLLACLWRLSLCMPVWGKHTLNPIRNMLKRHVHAFSSSFQILKDVLLMCTKSSGE